MPPTLLGIMLIAFVLTRLVPGGPLEQAMAEARAAKESRGSRGGAAASGSDAITPEQKQKLKELYGLDRPGIPAFFEWLGVLPKNLPNGASASFEPNGPTSQPVTLSAPTPSDRDEPFRFDATVSLRDGVASVTIPADLPKRLENWENTVRDETAAEATRNPKAGEMLRDRMERRFALAKTSLEPWHAAVTRIEEEREGALAAVSRLVTLRYREPVPGKPVSVKVYRRGRSGVLQGDFGVSFLYGRPVLELIAERAPASAWLATLSLILTYIIAVPLGVVKAVRHGGVTDNVSSAVLFFAASIPNYIIAAMLMQALAHKMHLFPLLHLVSDDFDNLSLFGRFADLMWHTVLPLAALTAGQLAMMALMMKNSLMDNLGADYVRTAVAKGVPFRKAVTRHAFRLSLVPIATGFGNCVSVLLAGNFIVENIFDINGYGLLSYKSLVGRDYPVFLAGLVIGSVLLLLGNLISDICVALVDPRIRFDK